MKINELKRIAEENDYEYEMRHFQYKLKKKQGMNCITISNDAEKTLWISNKSYCDKKDFNMIKAAVEFAETPINEREEETKYYLRHKYINKRNAYLVVDENQNCSLQIMGIDYELPTSDKAKFTEQEIENIRDYNNTDLLDFEMIEVEE